MCVYICPRSGPQGAPGELEAPERAKLVAQQVCVCVVDEGPCCFVLREPPNTQAHTEGCAPPPNHLHPARSQSLLIPAAPRERGCGTPKLGSGSAPPLLAPLLAADLGGQGAPAAIPTPSSQPLPPLPRRVEHRQGPLGLARMSAPPAAPVGHGRSPGREPPPPPPPPDPYPPPGSAGHGPCSP